MFLPHPLPDTLLVGCTIEDARFQRNHGSQFLFLGNCATRIGGSISEESRLTIPVYGKSYNLYCTIRPTYKLRTSQRQTQVVICRAREKRAGVGCAAAWIIFTAFPRHRRRGRRIRRAPIIIASPPTLKGRLTWGLVPRSSYFCRREAGGSKQWR